MEKSSLAVASTSHISGERQSEGFLPDCILRKRPQRRCFAAAPLPSSVHANETLIAMGKSGAGVSSRLPRNSPSNLKESYTVPQSYRQISSWYNK